MAPRRGMVRVVAPEDSFRHMDPTVARAILAGNNGSCQRPTQLSNRDGHDSTWSSSSYSNKPREDSRQGSSCSREQSLGASVGFLLSRARQNQHLQAPSLSSKRSRSNSNSSRNPLRARSCDTAQDVEGCKPPQQKAARKDPGSATKAHEFHARFTGLASVPILDKPLQQSVGTAKTVVSDMTTTTAINRLQPLWSLVGTFKTALENVVQVGMASLSWHQRNPKGGFQALRIPVSLITDVQCARVAVSRDESTYSVVIKTATKPSQVTFGFVRLCDAMTFKSSVAAAVQRSRN